MGARICNSKIGIKIMKKHEKLGLEAPKMHQKSIKMRFGTLRAASWKQVGSRNAKKGEGLLIFPAFWRKSEILGPLSESAGVQNGAQNRPSGVKRPLKSVGFGSFKRS